MDRLSPIPARGCLGATLSAQPLTNVTLSLGEETQGTPFLNAAGPLTLSRQSKGELAESMAEIHLLHPSPLPLSAPRPTDLSPAF